jgi:hypothetical protein
MVMWLNEQEGMWQKAVIAIIEVLAWHLPGEIIATPDTTVMFIPAERFNFAS